MAVGAAAVEELSSAAAKVDLSAVAIFTSFEVVCAAVEMIPAAPTGDASSNGYPLVSIRWVGTGAGRGVGGWDRVTHNVH